MAIGSSRGASGSGWVVPLAVLIVGSFMSTLDTSIVNVAIPHIQTDLGAAADDVAWVATGYTLVLGVVVPLSGWLGQRFGLTSVYTICLVGFAIASGLCGLAWNLDALIGFRILQALPGGVLPVVTMTLLYRIVPKDKIGSAMGVYGLGVVVAPAVGPTLGGYLVEYVDWRLIFYINVPIGILGSLAALAIFPRVHPTSWPRFDVWGFVTIAYGLFALLLAFSEGQDWGWDGYRIEILIVSGLLSLATFVVIELEVEHPLVDLRVFSSWPFTNSLLLLAIAGMASFSTLYYIPQFLQVTQGLQALDAGLVMMPPALVLVVLTPITGRLYDRIGARWLAVSGLLLIAYGQWLLAHITPDVPRSNIVLWLAVAYLGIGLTMMPVMTSGLAALPNALTDSGSAMNNVVRQVSSSVSVAVFTSLLAIWQAQLLADRGALIPDSVNSPAFNAAAGQGTAGLQGLYQQLQSYVATESYADIFIVVAVLCAAGAVLALLLRSGPPTPAPADAAPAAPSQVVELAEPLDVAASDDAGETAEQVEYRRNQQAAHAAAGVHLPADRVDDVSVRV